MTQSFGRLNMTIHTRIRLNPDGAWQNTRTASYTWPDEQMYERRCEFINCSFNKTTEAALSEVWPNHRSRFASGATITNNTALDANLTTTLRTFLQARQRSMYDGVRDTVDAASSPVHAAVKRMNTAARLLQAYTRLGMPLALDSDDVLSANLFGQYQLPVNMPTDAKIADAYGIASANYACGAGPCPLDPSRPLLNQVSVKVPCEATGGANLPGDPLGDCLVASARSRIVTLSAQYSFWAQQMAAGAHRERLAWVNDTLIGLRITNRLTHAG